MFGSGRKRSVRIVLTLLAVAFTVGVFLIIFGVSEADPRQTWQKLRTAHLGYVALALGLSAAEELVKACRWRLLLRQFGCVISFREAAFLLFANLPIRGLGISHLGDLSKVAYLKRRHGVSIVTSVASMLGELVLSLGTLAILVFVGCMLGRWNPYQLLPLSGLGVTLFGVVIAATRVTAGRAWLSARAERIARESTRQAARQLLDGVARWPARVAVAIAGLSVAIESGKLLSFWLLARSLGIDVPLWMLVTLVPTVMIVAKVPLTPASLGTREGAILFLFRGLAGDSALIGMGVLFSLAEYIFPMLIGLTLVGLLLFRIAVGRGDRPDAAQQNTEAGPP